MRGERQVGELSLNTPHAGVVLRPKNADTCKAESPCLHISKRDIRLMAALVHNIAFDPGTCALSACVAEASPVPEPIIAREADAACGLDESLSCHVSVSRPDCGKANYR